MGKRTFFGRVVPIAFALAVLASLPAHGQVEVLRADSLGFAVRTGAFVCWYDRSSTGGMLFLATDDTDRVVLANLLCGGNNVEPLRPDANPRIVVHEEPGTILILVTSTPAWGEIRSTLTFEKSAPGMLSWRVEARARSAFSPWRQRRPLFFFDRVSGTQVSGDIEVYATQAPWCAGVAFFAERRYLKGTVFYFQNFTSLNRYFEIVGGGPQQAIYLSSKQFGFVRPVNAQIPLPAGEWVTLEHGYLVLEPGIPEGADETGLRFLRALATVLRTVERPWSDFNPDWLPIAEQTLKDLEHPSCWVDLGGGKYLRAYVDVPRFSSAEAIAQLDVLSPLAALEKALGNWSLWRYDDLYLIPELTTFLQPAYHVFVNDYPPFGVHTHNGWYQLQLLLDLAELVKTGGPAAEVARPLLQESLPTVIELARANNYRFYEGFRYSDYSVWGKLEADATGGFAYLMQDAADFFGEPSYLEEARKALAALPLDEGFDFTYEAHFSAITAAACARMARLTGDPAYLDRAYLPLASLFRIVWWWECDYGFARHYQTFGGLSPMAGAGVITPKEQVEAWLYLREYAELVRDQPSVPELVKWLVSLFLEETPRVLYFCLPPNLPREAVWTRPTIYNSLNNPDLMIPLEDLRQGWEQSGKIGQEIYGAGMTLAFAAAQVTTGVKRTGATARAGAKPLLEIWPNPTKRGLRLRVLGADERVRIRVLDARGRIVAELTGVPTNRVVDLGRVLGVSSRSSGVYFIVAESGGKRAIRKAVLLR